jgi:hypothetical protein
MVEDMNIGSPADCCEGRESASHLWMHSEIANAKLLICHSRRSLMMNELSVGFALGIVKSKQTTVSELVTWAAATESYFFMPSN